MTHLSAWYTLMASAPFSSRWLGKATASRKTRGGKGPLAGAFCQLKCGDKAFSTKVPTKEVPNIVYVGALGSWGSGMSHTATGPPGEALPGFVCEVH